MPLTKQDKPPYQQFELERARQYEHKRFHARPRTRKLDKWEKDLAQRTLERVGGDSHVLDAPCGTGRFLDTFKAAREVTMLDISPAMLQVGQERAAGLVNVRFVLGDITAVPLPDGSVDLCWCMRLFHHLPDDAVRAKVLTELARVSKRYVALTFYNRRCWRYFRRWLLRRPYRGFYTTFDRLTSLARDAGLKPVFREPKVNVMEQQCFVLFEKADG